jgi:hypothetical protein
MRHPYRPLTAYPVLMLDDPGRLPWGENPKTTRSAKLVVIPQEIRDALISNWHRSREEKNFDPTPVLKLFLPWAQATWLVAEMSLRDRDSLFGVAIFDDEAELGSFSLADLVALTGPGNLRVEIDPHWQAQKTLSQYAAKRLA